MTDHPIPPEQVGTVASLIELAERIARLYGPKAIATIMCVDHGSKADCLIYPYGQTTRHMGTYRLLHASDWIGLLTEAERDAETWVMSHREMVAGDLGIVA